MRLSTRIAPALSLALALLSLPGPARGQEDRFNKVVIRTEPAGPGVAMLSGAGGNMGVCAGDDGVFVIDDEFAPLTARIMEAITKISPKPVRFLVNTHWHGDHTGGNENMEAAGALIVAHDNVRKRMSVDQFMVTLGDTVKASPWKALPIVTFTDAVTFHINGQDIEVFHVPSAHTDGDAIVWFKGSNVVHMGDVFFNGMYPFIDLDSGGSAQGVLDAVDRVLALAGPDTRFIPGHGPLGGLTELREYRRMLATCIDNVRKAVAAGQSRNDAVAAHPTAAFDDTWGRGFIKPDAFAGTLYDSLSK